MKKTTVYLDDDLVVGLKAAAERDGISEAEFIRASLRHVLADTRPRPRGGLYAGEPIAHRVDELLTGFGEH